MPRKKLYERKVSTYMEKVHLFEVTENYVKGQTKATGQSRAAVIRELCEAARQVQMTDEQFRSGTTKIYQAVTNNLLKKNLDDPLAQIRTELKELQGKFQEMELNARFGDEEVFGVLRAFYIENQMLARLLHQLLESNEITVDIDKECKLIRDKYATDFDTRKDAFFAKYEQLFMEKLVNDAQKSGAEDAAETAASEDGGEDSDEDSGEDSEAIQAGSESVN